MGKRLLNTAITRGSDTWVSFLQNSIAESADDSHYSSLAVTNVKLDPIRKLSKCSMLLHLLSKISP
ncbi:hypothetical protein [Brevinema andersonii]|uniref:hypothetical protein n=1 Tax=Brevinema andersonii TaxID=34097 RepID=UPI001177EE3B|nr:hypothetical protein [Brevinema andersonii]